MKGLLLLLCAMLSAEAAAKTTYDGFQVLSILPQTEISARYVHGLGDDVELDMWMESRFVGHESHLMVPPHRLDDITKRLTKRNIPFSVHIENVQEGLDIEARRLSKKGKAFSYDEYNTLEDIYAEIENLAANCPAGYTCETYDIGETTVEGNTIPVLHLYGSGSDRGAIWIDSTIHAREWLAPATVFRFMRKIFNQDDAEAIDLLNKYDFYFVPMMNPDGYDWTWTNARLWRKNREPNEGSTCFGTDLNRNYATHWSESGTSTSPCSDTYQGSGPGSCLETVAVQSEIDRIGSTLTAFVSVHTYGNYWLHAWGNQVNGSCLRADDHEDLYRVANAAADSAAAIYGTRWARGNSCETIYPASGLTLEYAKDPGGCKYTFTPELRGRGFNPPPTEIDPSEEEFWAAMVAQMNEIEAIEAGKK